MDKPFGTAIRSEAVPPPLPPNPAPSLGGVCSSWVVIGVLHCHSGKGISKAIISDPVRATWLNIVPPVLENGDSVSVGS